MSYGIEKIDHINLRIPVGGEAAAQEFWIGVLGFENVPKPANVPQGGGWFSRGNFEIHVSPREDFQPITGGHIAFRVQGLDELAARFVEADINHQANAGPADRPTSYFLNDPFGNRLEVIAS